MLHNPVDAPKTIGVVCDCLKELFKENDGMAHSLVISATYATMSVTFTLEYNDIVTDNYDPLNASAVGSHRPK